MRFEVEENVVGDKTLKRVNIFPSDERGVFLVQHEHYRQRAVGSIGLAGMSQEDVERLEDGATNLDDLFVSNSEGQVVVRPESVRPVTTLPVDGSGNSVRVEVLGFREMSMVPLRNM